MKKLLVTTLIVAMGASVSMATMINVDADGADLGLFGNGTTATSAIWAGQASAYLANNANWGEYISVFQLPDLGGESVSNVTLKVALKADTWQNWGNVDIYGVRSSASATVALSDYGVYGDNAGNGTKVQDNFFLSGTGDGTYQDYSTDASGNTAFKSWLVDQYTNVGVGGYVFLRLQPDGLTSAHGISAGTSEYTDTAGNNGGVGGSTPVLTIETIPEPATLGLVAGFAGAIIFIRRKFMI